MKNFLLLPSFLFLLFTATFIFNSRAEGVKEAPSPRAFSLRQRIEALEKDSSPEALYHLSILYENGYDSIARDSLRALSLLKTSAERGYAPAQNYLGFRLYTTRPDSALYWLERAAEGGDPKAMSNLAYLILSGQRAADSIISESAYARAVSLLSRSADEGVAPAMAALADLYREGKGVEIDTLRAESLYLDAVKGRFQEAEKKLLSMNLDRYASFSPEQALAEGLRAAQAGAFTVAFNLYSRAAQGDIPRAYTLLADSYSSAKGTDYNHEAALSNYILGALAGDPSAQFILAELLEIFPDALSDRLPEGYTDEALSPSYWYALAAAAGVSSARQAADRLFKIAVQTE